MAYYESNLSNRDGMTFIQCLKECRKVFKAYRHGRLVAKRDLSRLSDHQLADIGLWREDRHAETRRAMYAAGAN